MTGGSSFYKWHNIQNKEFIQNAKVINEKHMQRPRYAEQKNGHRINNKDMGTIQAQIM